jgi:hypothetical protein
MEFNMQSFDENSLSSGISPILEPGSHMVRLLDMYAEAPAYDSSKRFIVLLFEGPELGDSFKGLHVDRNNPELGTFDGQVGHVKHDRYPFGDFTTKDGRFITMAEQVMQWVARFAQYLGVLDQMKKENIGKGCSSIEEFVDAVRKFMCSPDKHYKVVVAGQEYTNNKGYIAHRLFLPRAERGRNPIVPVTEQGSIPENLMVYSETSHIIRNTSSAAATVTVTDTTSNDPLSGFNGSYSRPDVDESGLML